jgi:hypothetical protein
MHMSTATEPSPSIAVTLRRAAELLLLGVVPVLALVLALSAYSADGRLALDFHEEVYPQAQAVVHGDSPYPSVGAPITDTSNAVWPVAAVLPVVPLTALPAGTADWVATFLELGCLFLTLWVLAVRDWRIYGVTLLWPAVIDAYQTANVTLALGFLLAVVWRFQRRELIAGLALGVALAVKFFLWPFVVWLLAVRRRWAAAVSVAVGAASLLLLLPFVGLGDYVRLVDDLAHTFDGLSYTPYALLLDLGAPEAVARGLTTVLGAALLVAAWRRRSLGLALGAALCLSPIVWRHFFALLVVPLAIARPRFDAAWLVPLGMWAATGTFNGAPWQTALVLALAGATLVLAERPRARRVPVLTPTRVPADA